MPDIRQYSSQISESGIPQGRRVAASDFQGGVGTAAIAKGAEDAVDYYQKVESRKQKLEAEKLYSDAFVKFAQERQKLSEQATGDEDFTGQVLGLWDKTADDLDKQLSSEEYRKQFGDKPYLRNELKGKFLSQRDNIALQSIGYEAQIKAQKQKNDFDAISNNAQNIVIADPTLYDTQKETVRRSAELLNINPVEREQMIRAADEKLALSAWSTMNDRQQASLLSKSAGGEDAAINAVLKNEGGFVGSDGASGAPAIYGINQKWHKEAFAEAQRITEQKGIEAGREYARTFYKKEYWDKYNIASLPPETQTIVMDGVVNHSPAFAKKLIEAARTEAPDSLIAMRLGEYQRLAEAAPDKYGQSMKGWENRLKSVAAERNIPIFADLSPQAKVSEINKLKENLRKDAKLKIDDPAKWGIQNGMTLDQIVSAQQNPQTAAVIPNDDAKQLVQRVKNAQTPDEIVQFANDIKQSYGDYSFNAVRDMKKADMADEYEAMMSLALDNPVANHQQLALLMDAAKVGGKGLDEAYKSAKNVKPSEVDDKTSKQTADVAALMLNEGYSIEDVNRNVAIVSSLAKAYQIKNPSVGMDDAIDFAMQNYTSKYATASLGSTFGFGGKQYRVPRQYDVNAVEERLAAHYQDLEFSVNAQDEKIAKSAGAHLKDLAMPFMNAAKTGIRFRAPTGEVLLDKKTGLPAELTFDYVIKQPTPSERKQEEINASFDKREPRF